MGARRYPISGAAIVAAAQFLREGSRSYARTGEPSHPSLRQVAAHLVVMGLATDAPPAATLARALERAGIELPAHWRSRPRSDVNISGRSEHLPELVLHGSLCSSVDDGARVSPRVRRSRPRPSLHHPWRRRQAVGAPS